MGSVVQQWLNSGEAEDLIAIKFIKMNALVPGVAQRILESHWSSVHSGRLKMRSRRMAATATEQMYSLAESEGYKVKVATFPLGFFVGCYRRVPPTRR